MYFSVAYKSLKTSVPTSILESFECVHFVEYHCYYDAYTGRLSSQHVRPSFGLYLSVKL